MLPPAPPTICLCQIGYTLNSLSLPTTCFGPQNNLEVRFASSGTICRAHYLPPSHSAFLGSLCLSLFRVSISLGLSLAHISVILCLFLLVFVFLSSFVSLCVCI